MTVIRVPIYHTNKSSLLLINPEGVIPCNFPSFGAVIISFQLVVLECVAKIFHNHFKFGPKYQAGGRHQDLFRVV
jgi:hypothetical protein